MVTSKPHHQVGATAHHNLVMGFYHNNLLFVAVFEMYVDGLSFSKIVNPVISFYVLKGQ